MRRQKQKPESVEGAVVDALRVTGELHAMLTLTLSEIREESITPEQRANSVRFGLTRSYRLACQCQHILAGLP